MHAARPGACWSQHLCSCLPLISYSQHWIAMGGKQLQGKSDGAFKRKAMQHAPLALARSALGCRARCGPRRPARSRPERGTLCQRPTAACQQPASQEELQGCQPCAAAARRQRGIQPHNTGPDGCRRSPHPATAQGLGARRACLRLLRRGQPPCAWGCKACHQHRQHHTNYALMEGDHSGTAHHIRRTSCRPGGHQGSLPIGSAQPKPAPDRRDRKDNCLPVTLEAPCGGSTAAALRLRPPATPSRPGLRYPAAGATSGTQSSSACQAAASRARLSGSVASWEAQ